MRLDPYSVMHNSFIERIESSENTTQLQNTQKNSKHSGQQCACHVSLPCRYVTQVAMTTVDFTGFVFFLAVLVRAQPRLATHLDKSFLVSFFCVIVFNKMHCSADLAVLGVTHPYLFNLFTIIPRVIWVAKITLQIITKAGCWKINKSKVSVVLRLRTCDACWNSEFIWRRDH